MPEILAQRATDGDLEAEPISLDRLACVTFCTDDGECYNVSLKDNELIVELSSGAQILLRVRQHNVICITPGV